MKFNYLATILIGTVALASNFNAGQANAIDCSETKTISVPWSWQLSQSGDSKALLDYANTGSPLSTVPGKKTLDGAFIVKLLFDEPSNYCTKLGNAPTATALKIVGSFSGVLSSNFLPVITVPPHPASDGPFAGASASVNILEAFLPETLDLGLLREEFSREKETVRTVGDGSSISFAGNLESFATKGLNGGGFSAIRARLDVTGAFTGTGATSGTVDYTVPVPEPLTMLASATALGFGAFFKRQNSKNPKKS
jgi:hypothetical protein